MLHIHRSERADRLADALGEVLSEPPGDAFEAEVVAVPARGMERWLAQRLSHVLGAPGARGDGVCANVRFLPPSALIAEVLSVVTGIPAAEDAWEVQRLAWPLLDTVEDCGREPWCALLGRHLGLYGSEDLDGRASRSGGAARGRRLDTAMHLAELYSRYFAARPQMIRDWLALTDTDGLGGTDAGGDGAGLAAIGSSLLPADLRWQAQLWRRLRERVGTPSPAERLPAACAALRDDPTAVRLPGRLSLFGVTRLTFEQVAVLRALSDHREVHLWLPHPSPALWQALRGAPAPGGPTRRRQDPTAGVPRHPLLASLGCDVRELQLTLTAGASDAMTDEHLPGPPFPDTLLGCLQAQLRDDCSSATDPPVLAGSDRSVQVHACHGRSRQVEVLREVLLDLLAGDPTLELRDVLVMCPDIEHFAPLISSAFGLGDQDVEHPHPGHLLQVRLADRSLHQTNPLLAVLVRLLELADSRMTASQVLDFAATSPVRRRFRFDDEDAARLRDWVRASGVRWGLDRSQRAAFGLSHVGQNTWQAGLDRVLLGAAMADEDQRWLGLALPLDDVDSSDIDLAGRFAELIDRLSGVLDALSGRHPLPHWLNALSRALDLLTDVPPEDSWQLAAARRALADVAAAAGSDGARGPQVSLSDVRTLLASRFAGRPTRAGFRTGQLTMCTMVPMRSVPHRVVCLLGLDDGVFPRSSSPDGDDILLRDPCIGERDPRNEDRQLLLDAIMAAQDHLILVYSGANERTNAPLPPAVPLGELLDALDRCAIGPEGRLVREMISVHHPLQPFDQRNFVPGALGVAGSFSHDQAALAGARRSVESRSLPGAFLARPLPAPTGGGQPLDIESLIRFLTHPVKAFLQQSLGVVLTDSDEQPADHLSLDLTGLERWQVGDSLLTARLSGQPEDVCQQAEWRRGLLPPGPIGREALRGVCADVEPLVTVATPVRVGEPVAVDVAIPLPGGRVLTGTVPEIYRDGEGRATVVRPTFSRLAARQRLRSWVHLLALSASRPGTSCRAVTLGRGSGKRLQRSVLAGIGGDAAAGHLAGLVDLWERGLHSPLPFVAAMSCSYAVARHRGDSVGEALERLTKEWDRSPERTDRHHVLVWGDAPALDALTGQPATAAESWLPDEKSRFGQIACRVWFPLLDHETIDAP